MSRWSLDDIPWHSFDPERVDPSVLKIAKAAALTESNGKIYGQYLARVFHDEPSVLDAIVDWAEEEVRHGEALGRWCVLADPSFDYAETLGRFRAGYSIDVTVDGSIRGSKASEMVARCIVEAGTSSFYSALRDWSDEPLFKVICGRIAGDEFRHYKLFLDTLNVLLEREGVGFLKRLKVALGRVLEIEDDELPFAFHCANYPGRDYIRAEAYNEYIARAFATYQRHHARRAANMVMKAAGLSPQGPMGGILGNAMWFYVRGKARGLAA
jgi:hypothetical protein